MNQFPGCWDGDKLLGDSIGLPARHPVPPRSDAYIPIDFTNLYLGIDDSDDHVARVVCLDGAATRLPRPICCRRFKNPAKLLAYVKGWARDSGSLHVALTRPNRVSGPALTYLEEFEGIPVTRLGEDETLPYDAYDEEWEAWDTEGPEYVEAFCLALTLAYRVSAPNVLDDLRYLADEAEAQLDALKRCLDRLSWATRVPF